jgi:hypothetical protein
MHQGRLERTAGVEPVSVLVACECGECSSMHGRRWQERVQLGPCVQGGCMRYLVYIPMHFLLHSNFSNIYLPRERFLHFTII